MGPPAKSLKTEVSVSQIMAMEKDQMVNLVKMSYGSASMQDLLSLVSSFLSEVKPPDKGPTEQANTEKKDNVKEKCRIKERLMFFHSIYKEISEPKNNVAYLSAMSDLLALYIDLEVMTCLESIGPEKKKRSERREKEEKEKKMKELMSRIVSSLYTMLDKSEDHILDTVLKLRPPFSEDPSNEIFHGIYASIYRCVAKRAANRQIKDLTYVRYVLVYKLWDNIAKDNEREDVVKQAATRLRPPPGFLKRRRTLPRILPKPSMEVKNLTEFFLRERYNVWKRAKKLLEATSQAAHQSTMFPNLSCKPRLLNPRIQETPSEPSPTPNASLEEISTPQSVADDLWRRLRCEEPISETSLYDQVTNFDEPRKLSVTKMYKVLNRHKVQVRKKLSKKVSKKDSLSRPKGAEKGGYLKRVRSPTVKGDVLQVVRKTKSQKSAKNTDRNNKKRNKAVDFHEPPVLKKVKIELWEPENHVPVHSSYDTYKKEPPVISAAVSPFIANITKPSGSELPPPVAPPTVRELKPNMVDASVSSVDDFDWTMDFLKQSLDLKHDQGWQQSSSSFPEKQLVPVSEKSVKSVFEKPKNCQVSQIEDLIKGPVQGNCGPVQKKDQVKINVEGAIGMMVDSQLAADLSGFDLDEPMWGPLDGSGQYSGHVDPMTDPLLHEWFNDCPHDELSTPAHPGSESQDIWSHNFSTS